jgi:hypothetical protein
MTDSFLAILIITLCVVAALGTCHEQDIQQARWSKCIDKVKSVKQCEELK